MTHQLSHPEPLHPRTAAGARLFTDERLDHIAYLLDECFRLPGTRMRFGLDGIIGLVPGLGDILAGLASCIIVIAAWARGVPMVTLLRMLANLAIEVIVGAIPFLGDAFGIVWKANRRNYRLLTLHITEPRRHTWRDWLVLAFMAACLALMLIAPLAVLWWIAASLLHLVHL